MQKKVNPYRIYLRATREWVKVSEGYYKDNTRYYDALRKRQQSHGRCVCPKNKLWLCDGDCYNCEFCRAGDMLSLDYTTVNDNGDTYSPMDMLKDQTPSIESLICDKVELDQLFERLNELMPEARRIGDLRMVGLSDAEIAKLIGIPRTTFLSRLKRAKELLQCEYPDLF